MSGIDILAVIVAVLCAFGLVGLGLFLFKLSRDPEWQDEPSTTDRRSFGQPMPATSGAGSSTRRPGRP